MKADLNLTKIDELGMLLAQIADLTAKAEEIKDSIKEIGSAGGQKVWDGALFKATYSESNTASFNKEAFIKEHGAAMYDKYTKTSARFTVKVTAR